MNNHTLDPASGHQKSSKNNTQRTQSKNRGASLRAQKRSQDDATKIMSSYLGALQKPHKRRANVITHTSDKLKITFLGGLNDVGEKNMTIIEYGNDAIILDCGNNLGVDLPGVNYEINDTAYLDTIKHKIKGYIITHGHLDHIGGLKHTVPKFPAPIYGSRYTIGVIEKSFIDSALETGKIFTPDLVTANADSHEQLRIGTFSVEFIRVTHSLPDATALCISTPVGKIIATGDFRLDPEPLDHMPTDTKRLKQLGDEGVLLLLSESSYADAEGRVPTESTLQQSFHDIIGQSEGRIFVAAFSSNMNRAQMIINAAVAAGRKVALDGRGMLSYAEIAVRQGILRVPKGVIIPISQAGVIPAAQLLVMCTGGQGEPNAALQRMSEGQHKYVNLSAGDTVVISSSPIPGNEARYDQISNRLSAAGVHLYRHPTHEIDGCGPLHVSGHAKRDELREMLQFIRPHYFVPVHGGALRRSYHAELAIQDGMKRQNVFQPHNGDSMFFTENSAEDGGSVLHGSVLVDQNGCVVDGLVIKDRLLLSQSGIVTVILTIEKYTGQSLTSPDIISRGFIPLKDNEELLSGLRQEIHRAIEQRFKRLELDRFKQELREHIVSYLFERTGQSPVVIPVINSIGSKQDKNKDTNIQKLAKSETDQERFQAMRARLLVKK